jgi:hypothetical protein
LGSEFARRDMLSLPVQCRMPRCSPAFPHVHSLISCSVTASSLAASQLFSAVTAVTAVIVIALLPSYIQLTANRLHASAQLQLSSSPAPAQLQFCRVISSTFRALV